MKMAALVLAVTVASCADPEERYDVGYDDGYAVGYNSTCQIRATLIEGDFENKDYSRGYADGQSAGVYDCRNRRN